MAERPRRAGFMAAGKVEVSLMKDAAGLNHGTLTAPTREKQKGNFRGFLLPDCNC